MCIDVYNIHENQEQKHWKKKWKCHGKKSPAKNKNLFVQKPINHYNLKQIDKNDALKLLQSD